MTDNAQLNGNAVADTPAESSFMSWSVGAQEVDNNRSLINWNVGWIFGTYSCRGLRQGAVVINGVTVYVDDAVGDHVHNFNAGHDHRPALVITSGSLWIAHEVDGSKTLSAYVRMTGFSGQFSEGSGSWDLPVIPRFTSAPSLPVITEITQHTARVTFTDGTGGAPIDGREIGWGTNTDAPTEFADSDGSDIIGDLGPNTTYFVWARTHNAAGYSEWSPRATFETIAGARVKQTFHRTAIPYVKVSGVWKIAQPWVNVLGEWKKTI